MSEQEKALEQAALEFARVKKRLLGRSQIGSAT